MDSQKKENKYYNELVQLFTIEKEVYPNQYYNISALTLKQVQDVQKQFQNSHDYIVEFKQIPICAQDQSVSCMLCSYSPNNKIIYSDYRNQLVSKIAFPCFNLPDDIDSSTNNLRVKNLKDKFNKFSNYLHFPQQIGFALNLFVNECSNLNNLLKENIYICILDFESYYKDVVSEVGYVLFQIQNKTLIQIEEYHSIIKRQSYNNKNLEGSSIQSAKYVEKKITGIPFNYDNISKTQIQNFKEYSVFINEANQMDNKYQPIYFSKSNNLEKQILANVLDRKNYQILELLPLMYVFCKQVPYKVDTMRCTGFKKCKCEYHTKNKLEYHCAIEDVKLYSQMLVNQKMW